MRNMKRKLLGILCGVLVIGGIFGQKAQAAENIAGQERLLVSVESNGAADSTPAVVSELEMEFMGPEAFYVSGETILLDDSINHRILVYEDGSFAKSIGLEWYMDVQLIYFDSVTGDVKLVYQDFSDTSYSHMYMARYQKDTGLLTESQDLCANGETLLEYQFDTAGNLITQYLPDENDTAAIASAEENVLMYQARLSEETNQEGYSDTSDITVGINGQSIYSVHSTYFKDEESGSLLMTKCVVKSDNENVTSYLGLLPDMGGINRGSVQVDAQGKVYQLVVDEDRVSVYELVECDREQLGTYQQNNKQVLSSGTAGEASGAESVYAVCKPMSRETIRERMETYRNLIWTFNSSKNSNLSVTAAPERVKQPDWLTALADGQDHRVVGVPYCWGGWNAETFVEHINNGKFAGNVCTPDDSGYVSGTVGMDCSGYVSVAFDLPSHCGTGQMSTYFEDRNGGDPQAYDILNKPNSHVVIVLVSYTVGGKQYVNIYEESCEAGKTRVQTGVDYMAKYADNKYNAMYYKNLQ